jgi:hypothetical protein
MPIRINLLAEAQAAEEVRRKDPAKRAIWVALVLIAGIAMWICLLQTKIIVVSSTLSNRMGQLNLMTNQYTEVMANENKLRDVSGKLTALNHFANARYLEANPLDALLRASVDGIQLIRLRTEQEVDAVVDPRPVSTERDRLILDVKDSSANPGNEQINKYKQILAATPYFKTEHISTNNIQLRNLGIAQIDTETGKPYVQFTLECVYPDKVRSQ